MNGQSSGSGAFLWWVPLLLGLLLLGCLMGLLASRWPHLTTACCRGPDYDEVEEEEAKAVPPSREVTFAENVAPKMPRGASFFVTGPSMMMQVPLVPAVAVANIPPDMVDARTVKRGSEAEVQIATPRSTMRSPRSSQPSPPPTPMASPRSLRGAQAAPQRPQFGSPRGSLGGSPSVSPMVSPRGSLRAPCGGHPGSHSPLGSLRAPVGWQPGIAMGGSMRLASLQHM